MHMKNKTIETQKNIDITKFFTLHVQTFADEFIEAKTKKEITDAVRYAVNKRIPYFIIGGGSNTVLKNNRFAGLIIKNSYIFSKIVTTSENEMYLLVSSGYPMSLLVNETVDNGWEGFEYHKGLPGTLGGAIYMNSKWMSPVKYVSDYLTEAVILDAFGEEKKVDRNYFHFTYGYSKLQETREIFLEGIFRLKKNNPEHLREKAEKSLQYRKQTQPFGVSTCGCFFKNITESEKSNAGLHTSSAGFLIDSCGLKGTVIGNFKVSEQHANFIINTKHANSNTKDLIKLVALIKKKVQAKYGIQLKEEVVYLS